jgi:hypothetical protein
MSSAFKAITVAVLIVLGVTGCGQRIVQRPATLEPGRAADAIVIDADAKVWSSASVARTLSRGTIWDYEGRIAEGDLYRPRDTVLTVEGANVSEAYMVIEHRTFVGFYLPVQKTFSPAREPVALQFTKTE